MGVLSFFSAPIDIQINLDGEEVRPKYQRILLDKTDHDLGKCEHCPIYHDGETISGTVIVKGRAKGMISHSGVSIHLTGVIDDLRVAGGTSKSFLSTQLPLAQEGSSEFMELPFTFGAISLPHESFEGSRLQVRYCLQVTVLRTLSNRTYERTLWVDSSNAGQEVSKERAEAPRLDVGLPEILQLNIDLNDTRFEWKGIIKGRMEFSLVKTPIIGADLCIIRREQLGPMKEEESDNTGAFPVPAPDEFIARFQILDGPVERADTVPFRFHLASCLNEHSSPTKIEQHGLYSIRYYALFELHDTEQHRYYKAQEIIIHR